MYFSRNLVEKTSKFSFNISHLEIEDDYYEVNEAADLPTLAINTLLPNRNKL